MSTQAMPDKWAVKIESEAEAVELQALFPEDKDEIKKTYSYHIKDSNKSNCFRKGFFHPNAWGYSEQDFYESKGYTIYTLSQLKKLLK